MLRKEFIPQKNRSNQAIKHVDRRQKEKISLSSKNNSRFISVMPSS